MNGLTPRTIHLVVLVGVRSLGSRCIVHISVVVRVSLHHLHTLEIGLVLSLHGALLCRVLLVLCLHALISRHSLLGLMLRLALPVVIILVSCST